MDRNKLKTRYDNTRAASYVGERANDSRWEMENQAVATFLGRLDPGASVLDVPVGTGRFIPFYKDLGLRPTGVDASKDMLNKALELANQVDVEINLSEGDIFSLDFEDGIFDALVCMRFFNWIGSEDLVPAIRELTRVSRNYVILAIEHYTPISQYSFLDWSDARRVLIQAKRRFYMWRTRNDYVYHPARDIRRAFHECGLEVEEQVRIPRKKDEGIEYSVFLLKKQSVVRSQE